MTQNNESELLKENKAAMTNSILKLTDVTRMHGQNENTVMALRGVSMDIKAGELVAVMGPSGSGKSTMLMLSGGLDIATSGVVAVEGNDLARLSKIDLARLRRRSVGYVFQDLNLIPSLTAAENVSLPRELDGMSTRKARKEAISALELLDVQSLADRFPEHMSGGQQQRVAIARALIGDRRLILADEPTGALDTETGEYVMRALRERCDEGASVLLVTHDSRNAAWADRVVFIRDGLIIDDTGVAPGPEDLLTGNSK